jgi:formylglycine-generating enzyme required for sulfatase activity
MFIKKSLLAVSIVCMFVLAACNPPGGDDNQTTTTTTPVFGGGDPEVTTIESIYKNMVSISGGTFEMGCSPGPNSCRGGLPRHTVITSAFRMSAYEVTQAQWEAVMRRTPSAYDECGSNCPVESVDPVDVQNFIEELNNKTGKQYRLPTEAEWEYAARAGTTTPWYCGEDERCLDDIAWYWDNSGSTPHPVGQKQPNAWGLYDMIGNVYEMISDHGGCSYEWSPTVAPFCEDPPPTPPKKNMGN